MSPLSAAVLLLVLGMAAAAPVDLPAFKGVLVTGQFRCDDFLCPDWELDVARVDPAFREHLITKLAMLVPKSPIAAMSFSVLTAYHDASRTFYTVGLPTNDGGNLWTVTINGVVNASTIQSAVRFQYPSGMGPLVRIHASSNNTLYGIMAQGTLVSLNPTTGVIKSLGSVVPASAAGAKVSPASVLDQGNDNLYTFLLSDSPIITTTNLKTSRVTAATVTVKREHWELEALIDAQFIPTLNQVALFIAGVSSDAGFDQIVAVDTVSGNTTFINDNLAENNLFFMCDPSTKSCDTLQTSAYDPIEKRLYFQATQVTSSDDLGTTVLVYADLAAKQPYIDVGLDPFTFGYMGFQYVPVRP